MWWHPLLCLLLLSPNHPLLGCQVQKYRICRYETREPTTGTVENDFNMEPPPPMQWGSHNKGSVNNANCADFLAHRYVVPQMHVNKGMN